MLLRVDGSLSVESPSMLSAASGECARDTECFDDQYRCAGCCLLPTVRRSVDNRRTERRRVADLCVAAADCCTTGTNSAGEPCWVKEFTNVRLRATSRPHTQVGRSLDDVTAGSLLQRRSSSRGNKRPSAHFSATDGKGTEVSLSPPTVSGTSLSRCSAVGQV